MNYVYVVFSSFATANRVKSLIQNNFDIKSELMQTPADINEKSCSYCLKVNKAYTDTVWNVVKKNGLSSKGVFSDGDFSRVRGL